MTKGPSEAQLLVDIRKAVNIDRRVRVVRNSVGFDQERKIAYGLGVGSADLVGVTLDGKARLFALEVKSTSGRLSSEQRLWLEFVRKIGGFAVEVRSVAEALHAVDRAIQGASQ